MVPSCRMGIHESSPMSVGSVAAASQYSRYSGGPCGSCHTSRTVTSGWSTTCAAVRAEQETNRGCSYHKHFRWHRYDVHAGAFTQMGPLLPRQAAA
jgi:hypothetical protein